MGLPVVCNSKVGDVKEIVDQTASGVVVNNFTENEFDAAIAAIPELLRKEPAQIRNNAIDYYKLEHAIQKYTDVYRHVLNKEQSLETKTTLPIS